MARQARRADTPAAIGGGIDIRELTPQEVARADAVLPLSRLDTAQTYLVAWDGDEAVGHAHIAWTETRLGVPEVQDVFVRPDRRRRGIASALNEAAERLVQLHGYDRISLGVSLDNRPARKLYERLGYREAGLPPERVHGTITVRGKPFEVDDTLLYLLKPVTP